MILAPPRVGTTFLTRDTAWAGGAISPYHDSVSKVIIRRCNRCVMDATDELIEFDIFGVCNHCRTFDARMRGTWFPDAEGARRLGVILDGIRQQGYGKPYDCALGLSGGVDSCYVALLAAEWGLRPLVVHIDTGWNSEISVSNVERLVKHCGFELHTCVVDWEEMRDLQLAYLRAGVPNQDVPQDHAIFAGLYRFCVRNGVKTVLSGGNVATEGIFPESWHANAMDSVNLRAIHRKHGSRPLRHFPLISAWELYVVFPGLRRLRTIRPLNYLPYDRDQAIDRLQAACGWKPYGRKHGESKFTRLFQNHYLPTRFGFDKRKPHLSSMVVSDLITRDRALGLLQEPLYDPGELDQDIDYLCNKLGIARDDYLAFIAGPKRHHSEYPTWDRSYQMLKRAQRLLRRVTGREYRVYS